MGKLTSHILMKQSHVDMNISPSYNGSLYNPHMKIKS